MQSSQQTAFEPRSCLSGIRVQILAAAVLLLSATGGLALEVGQPAPEFEMLGSDGKVYKLDELREQNQGVVLAFFPMAFTPG